MKKFQDYLSETEQWIDTPQSGDEFDIEIAPDEIIETRVLEVSSHRIILEANQPIFDLLEKRGLLAERIARYGAVGNNRAVGYTTEGVMSEIDIDLHDIARTEDFDMLYDAFNGKMGGATQAYLERMFAKVAQHNRLHPDDQQEDILEIMMDQLVDDYGDGDFDTSEQMNEVSPPDMATSPAPGKPGTETDAIRYNRSVGLDKEIGQYKDFPPAGTAKPAATPAPAQGQQDPSAWQRAWNAVKSRVDAASRAELERQKQQNRLDMQGPGVNEAYDPNKADAYNRAIKAGQSPEAAEKAAGITDRDINDYEIDVNGVMKKLQPTMPKTPAKDEVIDQYSHEWKRVMELAGCKRIEEIAPDQPESNAAHTDPLAAKAADLAPVGTEKDPTTATTVDEAEYQGRKVPLGKPMRGDVKKFKVYVKDPKTGNVKKVNFGHGGTSAKRAGQKTMRIKKSDPARRKSFRARHNCDNPGPRTKARYWSCRAW